MKRIFKINYLFFLLSGFSVFTSCTDEVNEFSLNDRKTIAQKFFKAVYSNDNSIVKAIALESNFKEHQIESNFTLDGLKTYGGSRSKNKFTIHRVIAQDNYVFLHVSENLQNSDSIVVKAELYKFNEYGEIIEHWGNLQGQPKVTANGHTMIDGPNLNLSVNYGSLYVSNAAGFEKQIFEKYDTAAARNLRTENYIQHNPFTADGIESFIQTLLFLKQSNIATTIDNYLRISEGDFSVSMNRYTTTPAIPGFEDVFVFDIQRSEASGKGAEHWDIIEEIGSKENANKLLN